jgi:hypothetical protein
MELGWKIVARINLAQDMYQCLAVVNTVMNFRVSQKVRNFWTR